MNPLLRIPRLTILAWVSFVMVICHRFCFVLKGYFASAKKGDRDD